MIHLQLPDGYDRQPLPFYLAMEEWAAANLLQGQEAFFLWQVDPTVVFGRNQRVEKEVDIEFCRSHGIRLVRRKSGGGCIFADRNNVMFSYVADNQGEVADMFASYTSRVAAFLRSLGLDSSVSSRNDVMIGSRKVSGWAFLKLASRSIIHGTMLYDTDPQLMSRAITPSKSKLESKGVKSVASRITTVKAEMPELGLEEFKAAAIQRLTDSKLVLTELQVAEIEALAQPYYQTEWIYGPRSKGNIRLSQRFDGIGEFEAILLLDSDSNTIRDLDLRGDYLPAADIDQLIINPLRGVEFSPEAVLAAVSADSLAVAIPGFRPSHLIKLLFNQ